MSEFQLRCLFGWVLACLAARAASDELPSAAAAIALAREATVAAEAHDRVGYLAKMEAAVALRPDYPRMLVNLAAARVANDDLDGAVAALDRLAALGLGSTIDRADEFASLRGRPEFEAVRKKMAANLSAHGAGEIAFALRDVTGLIEGIAWREKTGEFFFGDVNRRAIWRRGKDGKLTRFTPDGDGLLGVFGLAIDERAGALWAATSAVSAMRGWTPEMDGTAALAEIDLESGAVRRVIPVVRTAGDRQSHVLGDLALAADGGVYVTDSGGPVIWRLAPGGKELEAWLEHRDFLSLQGIVLSPDGAVALVADYANGLSRIDLRTRAVRLLAPPPQSTVIGIDGMTLAPNGEVVAIQNGVRPNRVVRLQLEPGWEAITAVVVIESAHLTMAEPSLGCLGPGGDFFFIGNAGWSRFEDTEGKPSEPRSVPVFKTKLPPAPTK